MSEQTEQPDFDSLFAGVPHLRQRAFFAAYCQCGRIKPALRAAKLSRNQHWDWLAHDPEYQARFERVRKIAGYMLEERAMQRAMEGLVRKKFHKGDAIIDPETGGQYVEREFSEPLNMFLLKGFFPDKYRDNYEKPDDPGRTLTIRVRPMSGGNVKLPHPPEPPKTDAHTGTGNGPGPVHPESGGTGGVPG